MTDQTIVKPAKISPALVTAGTFLVAAVLIAARRPDQIRFPEAWNEDGAFVVRFLIEDGWRSIFVPVNGYLIVPSKIISYLALWLSFVHYPAVSTALAVAAQALCVTVVARAPTVLPARWAMAAAILFVPTNAETFALPEYTLWWTSLLLFVVILWAGPPASPWRYLLLLTGGISSPLVIVTLPALALNAAVRRRKQEIILLIAAIGVAGIQAYSVLTTDTASTDTFRAELIPLVVAKFFGLLTWAGHVQPLYVGLLIGLTIAAGVFALPRADRLPYCLLGGCLIGTIASAVYRAPVEILSPINGGPRYFFYPFILELWMLIWLAARGSWLIRALPTMVILGIAPLSYANFQRHQEPLTPWADHAIACSRSAGDTTFQVQHDGLREHAHLVLYAHAVCRKGVTSALFDRYFVSRRRRPGG